MDHRKAVLPLESVLTQVVASGILPPGSYLAGGTAVYFLLRRRISVDLDFFTPASFQSETVAFRVRELVSPAEVELMENNTLIAFLGPEKVKFSLFFLPYELLAPPSSQELAAGIVCPLASLEDIEAMKALALVQRGSAKDFVDLCHMLERTGHAFEYVARLVRKKYVLDERYNYHLKTAMVFFDDAERELPSIRMIDQAGGVSEISAEEWSAIKEFFVRLCR